jgi:hypothetical protein
MGRSRRRMKKTAAKVKVCRSCPSQDGQARWSCLPMRATAHAPACPQQMALRRHCSLRRLTLPGGRCETQEEPEGKAAQGADGGAARRGEAAAAKVRGRPEASGVGHGDGKGLAERSCAEPIARLEHRTCQLCYMEASHSALAHASASRGRQCTPALRRPRALRLSLTRPAYSFAKPRPEWEEEATLTTNYAANQFVLDPNEGFGRNLRPAPLKSKEEREAEDGETFSDDDGALAGLSCGLGGGGLERASRGVCGGDGGMGPQDHRCHVKFIPQCNGVEKVRGIDVCVRVCACACVCVCVCVCVH